MPKRSGLGARLVRTVSATAIAAGLAVAPMAANAAGTLSDRFERDTEASAKVYYRVPFGGGDRYTDSAKDAMGAGLALDWSKDGSSQPAAFDFRMTGDQPMMLVRGMETTAFQDRLGADEGIGWGGYALGALALGVAVYLIIDATDDDDEDSGDGGGGGGPTSTPLDDVLGQIPAP
ncbi:MAG: hypothetical protein ACPG06_01380 [Alphaproteobacteria bacterium]